MRRRPLAANTTTRLLALAGLLLAAGAVGACGDDHQARTTATAPATLAGVTDDAASSAPYTLVHETAFVGVQFYPGLGNAYPDLGEFRASDFGPVGNGFGSMKLYTRSADQGVDEMVVMWTRPERRLADAIRLTHPTGDLGLALSCEARAAVLAPARAISPTGAFVGDFDEVVSAWRPGPEGALEEFDVGILTGLANCDGLPLTTPTLPHLRAASEDPPYTVETAWDYIGYAGLLPRTNTYEGLLGEAWGTSQAFGSVGSNRAVVVYHRDLDDGHEDLAIVIAHDEDDGWISDALLLVDTRSDVHFAFSSQRQAVALLPDTDVHGTGSMFGALHVWTVNSEGHFVEEPAGATLELAGPTVLVPVVTYSTNANREPILVFETDRYGWTASDSVPCPPGFGTLRFQHEQGWVYVVPTADLTVDEAVEEVLDQLADTEVRDARLAGLGEGRRIVGLLERDVRFLLEELLPYHTSVEDVLPAPMLLGDRIEIIVVEVDGGIITVVLAPSRAGGQFLGEVAAPLLDSIEIVGEMGDPAACRRT